MEQTLVGFFFLILGGLHAVRPDLMLRFQVWSQRVLMDAKYEPGPRTYTIVRVFGALFIVIGLLTITGALNVW